MKKWICLVWLLVLLACADSSKYDVELDDILSGLNDNPSMALTKLDSMKNYYALFSTSTRMRWQLLRLSAQNKCDTVFRTNSLQHELVSYFDLHGTPNEQMYANYLLGRAYSDMGEVPKALKWFHKAVDAVDTTAANCDFYTLCGIYGQIALTFEKQHLYREEIEAWEKYSHYALKDGDTYNYIRGIEFQEIPYFCLDDTTRLFKTMEEARHLYLENGWNEAAAAVYSSPIFMLIQDRQYLRAYDMMLIYENESGLFDDSGNISPGREHYYYCRGTYHLGVHQVDSAEFYFRKLLTFQVNRNYDAYKGLNAVYRERQDVDSVMKYATLSEQALDSIQKDDQSEALAVAHSLYNYSRLEHLAEQREMEALQMRWRIALVIVGGFAILFFIIRRYRRYKKSKERELELLSKEYHEKENRLEQVKRELKLLKEDKNRLTVEWQDKVMLLQNEVDGYRKWFERIPIHEREMLLKKSSIVRMLHEKGKGKRNVELLTDKDRMELMGIIHEQLPSFYTIIMQNACISEEEKFLCLLCRTNFHNGEIAVLLDKSPQNVCNMKSNVNYKLFGNKKAGELMMNLKKL
ncbi:MAG: hypothetical protein IKR05_06965 [Prevotella sp.]|nr:hypothetical protein [Prevotella sp.]